MADSSNGAICCRSFGAGIVQGGLHVRLLLALLPADFGFHEIGGSETRGLIEPSGQNDTRGQRGGFAGEDDEDGLRDFLGVMGVAGGAQGGGIDKIHVARDERSEGVFGLGSRELGQQLVIRQFQHLLNDVHGLGKWTKNSERKKSEDRCQKSEVRPPSLGFVL